MAQTVENHLQCRRPGFVPWVGKMPWRWAWPSIPVFLPGESSRTDEPGVTKHSTQCRSKTLPWFQVCGKVLQLSVFSGYFPLCAVTGCWVESPARGSQPSLLTGLTCSCVWLPSSCPSPPRAPSTCLVLSLPSPLPPLGPVMGSWHLGGTVSRALSASLSP